MAAGPPSQALFPASHWLHGSVTIGGLSETFDFAPNAAIISLRSPICIASIVLRPCARNFHQRIAYAAPLRCQFILSRLPRPMVTLTLPQEQWSPGRSSYPPCLQKSNSMYIDLIHNSLALHLLSQPSLRPARCPARFSHSPYAGATCPFHKQQVSSFPQCQPYKPAAKALVTASIPSPVSQ